MLDDQARPDDHALSPPHGARVTAIKSSGANFDVIKQQKFTVPLLSLGTTMANKNDFTPEEWTKVLESIIAAGIAVSVAEAAVEGSFLGFGGVRVSDAETATLRDISKALGMAS